jgi:hypothetical protein
MLPTSRNTTYSPGTPVLSADLNDLQDIAITLTADVAAGKHGLITRVVPKAAAQWSASASGFTPTEWIAGASSQEIVFPIVLFVGETLTAVRFKVACAATDVVECEVFRNQPATANVLQLGSTESSVGHAGALETVAVTGLTELATAGTSYSYYALVVVTAYANHPTVFSIEYDVEAT